VVSDNGEGGVLEKERFEEYRQVFYRYLEKKRLSRTSERFAVMREVYDYDGHFEVEDLYACLKQKKYHVSRTTLYHTLELLEDCGLVRKNRFNGVAAMYECAFRSSPHDHVVLTDSGRIVEFSDVRIDEIARALEEKYHLHITGRSVIFYAESK
jgi:Fur family ferric uptake transcriptional regulator